MQILVLATLCLLFPPPADKKPAVRDNPKTAIKAILEEASDRYKYHIKAYQSAKTSADRTNALELAKANFEAWFDTIEDLPVSFDARLIDVMKAKSGLYYAVFEQGKDLQKFAGNTVTPTVATTKIYVEITEERSQSIKIGTRFTITGTISPTFSWVIAQNGFPSTVEAVKTATQPIPPSVTCLFMLNYAPSVFSSRSYDFFAKPDNYVTFILDDAAIQFDER